MCFETSRTQCVLIHATKKIARAVGLGCVEVFPFFTSEMFVKIDGLNITVALIFFGEVSVACYGQWCDHSPRRTGDPPKKADVSACLAGARGAASA